MCLRNVSLLLWLALCLSPSVTTLAAGPYEKIEVETSSTSIFVGKVTLHLTPLVRQKGAFAGAYKARVFPFFFMSEHGSFSVDVSDEDLARIARGETVECKGRAESSGREERKITVRAAPGDATHGKIKVRIFVTEKIELIFNTTYRFES